MLPICNAYKSQFCGKAEIVAKQTVRSKWRSNNTAVGNTTICNSKRRMKERMGHILPKHSATCWQQSKQEQLMRVNILELKAVELAPAAFIKMYQNRFFTFK